jgi:hypothetical protein
MTVSIFVPSGETTVNKSSLILTSYLAYLDERLALAEACRWM